VQPESNFFEITFMSALGIMDNYAGRYRIYRLSIHPYKIQKNGLNMNIILVESHRREPVRFLFTVAGAAAVKNAATPLLC
jgi:hypothetical protein